MFATSEGIFSVDQLNVIRDAHVAWCAEHSIDPQSSVGLGAMKLMIDAYRQGAKHVPELISACDRYLEEGKTSSPAVAGDL